MTTPGSDVVTPYLEQWMEAVRDAGLDGWLVADFRWNSPVFGRLLGLSSGILTRRVFLWIPAAGTGEPSVLASQVDGHTFTSLGYPLSLYGGFNNMRAQIEALFKGRKRIAMEYTSQGTLPTISRVDAGLVEMIRSMGVEVVSSGELVASMERWSDEQQSLHRRAAAAVDEARTVALRLCFERIGRDRSIMEGEIAQTIMRVFGERGMDGGEGPEVAVNANAADPHYSPAGGPGSVIGPDAILLIDLSCKARDVANAPYADSTWMAFTGSHIPADYQQVFVAARNARNAAIEFINQSRRLDRVVNGAEVDRVARASVQEAGMEKYLIHRTGHSLGTDHVHGMGTNLDAIEFPDDRPLIAGSGLTIEPGLYLPGKFGVRLEVSAIMSTDGLEITTETQDSITTP